MLEKAGLVSASQAVRVSFLPRRTLYIHTAWASEVDKYTHILFKMEGMKNGESYTGDSLTFRN